MSFHLVIAKYLCFYLVGTYFKFAHTRFNRNAHPDQHFRFVLFLIRGSLLAISNFPVRRQRAVEKVKRTVDALARELEEAMQKDLAVTIENIDKYVTFIAKPYQEKMQQRMDKLSHTLDELTDIENDLKSLQMEIQNFHVS